MAGGGGDADGSGGHGGDPSDGAPWLFSERSLRAQLSNIYAAMVLTTGNARLLLDRDPADVRHEDAEGAGTTRDRMAEACGWLAEARLTCETPRAFDDVFLGCARSAARYLVKVRDAGASTAHFDSWVFKKSSPPDVGAGPRTVISAVVPSLGTCMSVRAPQDVAEAIPLGFCRIGPATPMPLTNRLHCVSSTEAAPLPGRTPCLGDWDFLKASASDLDALSNSLEMDAFCEIASVQDDSWQRLGAPVILPGTVEDLDDSMVTFRGLGGEAVSALRPGGSPPPPDGLPHGGDALQAAGMQGRFLAVAWYQPRLRASASGSPRTRYLELLHFEECESGEAVLDDLIGHVRMRGRAGAGGLAARYGKDYASIVRRAACLTTDDEGAAAYGHAGGDGDGDGLVRAFLDTVAAMRAAWSQYRTGEGLPVAARDIASGERTDIASLASWVGCGGADRKNLLADIQHEFDLEGYWRGERDGGDGGAGSGRLDVPHIAAGLERQGLLSRNEGVLSVTDRGRKVLEAALRPDAERYASGRDVLYLPEAESRIPASVLMRYLRDGREFARAEGPDGRNALLWVREGADAAEDVKRYGAVLAGQHRLVLECARTANHPINARFVRSEMARRGERIACVHVSVMLGQLERAGRLESECDGEWKYPMRGRVIDTMLGEPARVWDMDGILGATGIAGRDIKDVGLVLAALASDGLIAGLEDGRWECRKDGMDEQRQRRRRAAVLAGRIVLSALRSKGAAMDSGRLVEVASGRLSRMFTRNQVRGLKGIVRDAVSSLVENGRVEERGGMLRLAS